MAGLLALLTGEGHLVAGQLGTHIRGDSLGGQSDLFQNLLARCVRDELGGQAPVSYTHLDVYKRQLLIRVWWVDVGRVGGTCDEDDTRWGCKNDPTMGKKDNPNPRLRKADIRTGQRWHLNDSGVGDTEYSLHRDWPDM